jgi:hypothetical protein
MARDEFRVEVDLDDEAHGHPLSERLRALDLDDEVQKRLGDTVIVTRSGPKLYVYTHDADAAREAERVVNEVLVEDGVSAAVRRRRWNGVDRFWQDADEPVPADEEEVTLDHLQRAREEGVPNPLFVFIESYEPEFMRDLGL